MQQPTPGSGWCERLELVLEGGGQLPGAIRVVDIRDQVLSCAADRQDDKALVRGQLQVFVYYNIAGNERIQGQSAEIPGIARCRFLPMYRARSMHALWTSGTIMPMIPVPNGCVIPCI